MFKYHDISQQLQMAKSYDNNGGINFMAHIWVSWKRISELNLCTKEKNEARGNGLCQQY